MAQEAQHVPRHENILYVMTEKNIMGNATPGRKKMELLHDMKGEIMNS